MVVVYTQRPRGHIIERGCPMGTTRDEEIRRVIKHELPALIREDPEIQDLVVSLSRDVYADRRLSDERFDRILSELARDREAQTRKWEENQQKWAENQKKWEENDRKWEQQHVAMREQLAEQIHRWAENDDKWAENNRRLDKKWAEHARAFDKVHEEIMAVNQRLDDSIGALGARWGMRSEEAFRNALAAILEKSFGVEVLRAVERDDDGEVFGRPDQVELDVIIKNGLLVLCEIKSSVGRADVYAFERKARFYERRHGQQADRLLIVSPMIDDRARKVGERLGIEMYSHSRDVEAQSSRIP
jgi:hypothetical protein